MSENTHSQTRNWQQATVSKCTVNACSTARPPSDLMALWVMIYSAAHKWSMAMLDPFSPYRQQFLTLSKQTAGRVVSHNACS